MAANAPPPAPHGFLNVCKTTGFTSHDVVAVARRLLGTRRVGHAGTLDPAAEGVLPLCVGRATRLVDALADADKGYYAEIVLGTRTTTDDAEGDVIATQDVPHLDERFVDHALSRFRGSISQRPPAYSAIKVGGRRAYDLARRGDDVQLRSRAVTIHRISLLWWRPPRLAATIACSKGTYVRSIARDLGEALGCGAHLSRLVRLWVGEFTLREAVSLDELRAADPVERIDRFLLPADAAVTHLPTAVVDPTRYLDMFHGRPWPMTNTDVVGRGQHLVQDGALVRVYNTLGAFLGLAVADVSRGVWRPRLSFDDQPRPA